MYRVRSCVRAQGADKNVYLFGRHAQYVRPRSSGQKERYEWHSSALRLAARTGLGLGRCRSLLPALIPCGRAAIIPFTCAAIIPCGRGLTYLALLTFIVVIDKV